MSDFTHFFWPAVITVVSLAGIAACAWLAWRHGRNPAYAQPAEAKPDTGHVWDGDLYELNNPPPRWWLWMFYLTVVFSLGYLIFYPGLGNFAGVLGWTQSGQYQAEREALDARVAPLYARFDGKTPEALAQDSEALAIGTSLFLNTCAQCHGSDARGARGYPNLTAGAWLHGGTADALRTTIAEGRHGVMPPMAAAVGTASDVRNVAAYVQSLSGMRTDSVAAARGKIGFMNNCAGCHGAEGKGNPLLGAPNLTDSVWLYGGSQADIIETITRGREGVMPAHAGRLTPQQIDLLVAYVLKVSGSPGR